ncbi:MAG: hypothetical protein ACPL3E_00325 [Minisyncoccia bacterium]
MNFLKKYYDFIFVFLTILFLAIIVLFFLKAINILAVNFDKALTAASLSKTSIDFNINDAILILQKRNLIQ